MIARRNFLGGLAGILSAGAAPAIIHNAMKIWVPEATEPALGIVNLSPRAFFSGAEDVSLRSKPVIKSYIDPHANSGQPSGLRRYQQIDTSRGFHLYEIPLVPVDAGKHVPILVPPERRVLRFT